MTLLMVFNKQPPPEGIRQLLKAARRFAAVSRAGPEVGCHRLEVPCVTDKLRSCVGNRTVASVGLN